MTSASMYVLHVCVMRGTAEFERTPPHHREISSGELNKTQLNFHHREILVAQRVVKNSLVSKALGLRTNALGLRP